MLRGRAGKGHWWGIVLDAPEPRALGMFYAEMLGWEIFKNEPNEFVLVVPGGAEAYMSFQPQRSAEWIRPIWPARDGHQQMMMHLDVEVGQLETAVAHAIELGATVADHQPQDNVRVLLGPAGHPFCLYVDE
ncbi:MAG TPA: VOC family protein [Mycobacteriales bacterium]|jgi:hypothetical protein|nr:VOC family protein [Mycobacteriales bacterium]